MSADVATQSKAAGTADVPRIEASALAVFVKRAFEAAGLPRADADILAGLMSLRRMNWNFPRNPVSIADRSTSPWISSCAYVLLFSRQLASGPISAHLFVLGGPCADHS